MEGILDDFENCETHCNSCVALNCDVAVHGCYFVCCPNACGANMHFCKVADHLEELCPRTVVSCINRELGCPLRMERNQIRKHLSDCPASVVYCAVQCGLPNCENHSEPSCVMYRESVQGRSISPFVPPISPAPPLPQVSTAPISSVPAKHVWSTPPGTSSGCSPAPSAFVRQPLTTLICNTKKQGSCGRLIQRVAAATHYRFHSDFLVPLNDSIEVRCPLYHLGCEFVATRLVPHSNKHQLVYHPQLSCLTETFYSPLSLSIAPSGPFDGDTCPNGLESTEAVTLDTLPAEIVCYLACFLDAVSLYFLSQVCSRLHILLTPLVRERMVVTPRWQRIVCSQYAEARWEIGQFVWSLPHRTAEISHWRWSPAAAEISAHLKNCPYNDIVVQDSPFCLTNGTRGAT